MSRPKSSSIVINVKSFDHSITRFRINKFSPMKRLMKEYCIMKNIRALDVKFYFKGVRIQAEDNAKGLKIMDGDKIRVVSQLVNLKIKDEAGSTEEISIHRHYPLQILMQDYCLRKECSPYDLQFLYDDVVINLNDTPKSLDMIEGDIIKVRQCIINIEIDGYDVGCCSMTVQLDRFSTFKRFMDLYCEQNCLNIYETRFIFAGQYVNSTDTPASLDMLDRDVIDVFQVRYG